jgi:O-acetyl-ADP-ribose deacetylase (regulator of RNase III)
MDPVLARIEVVVADITALEVDAIVNAANTTLLGGGGVDGAIHRRAGPELKAYTATLGGARTGEAKISPGFRLPARHVIHAVGPVWSGGARGEPELLASCYRRALELAEGHGLRSVAFSAISTGVYGFPKSEAADIAVQTVVSWLREHAHPERVVFCCFDAPAAELHRQALARIAGQGAGSP